MDPGSEFPLHIHPEDQLTHTLRGTLDQGVMDKSFSFTAAAGNTVYLPGGMVHSAKMGDTGADQLDVFWPVRPDYIERAQKQQELYHADRRGRRKAQKLAEGFTFTEGTDLAQGQAVLLRHVLQESSRRRLHRKPCAQPADRDGA